MEDKYNNKYEKRRLSIINNLIPLATDTEKALDVGCGSGKCAFYLKKKGFDVIGIDIDIDKIKVAQLLCDDYTNLKFEIGSVCSLKYLDNFFDIISCLEVIEHLKKPEKGLDEIYRVLKPGGRLIISTPNKLSLEGIKGKIIEQITGKKWNAWDDTHKKIFTSLEFIKLLNGSGFVPVNVVGYYYIPFEKVNFLKPFAAFYKRPFNYLGFNIIVECVKTKI